jgi:ABC-type multidrug transport system ATPase subunit
VTASSRLCSSRGSASAFFGLLGPDGAGKTTLIGSVCNIVRPTTGTQGLSDEAVTRSGMNRPGPPKANK